MKHLIDSIIEYEGDTWLVGAVGVVDDGRVYCHLWSQTRTLLKQKNGRKVPVQMCDFVPLEVFEKKEMG